LSPATAFPRKSKPECKDNAWTCPILSPQGDTSSSESRQRVLRPIQEPKPECKDNAWACPILSPQGNTSPSQSSFK
jgi:hypothetical protein